MARKQEKTRPIVTRFCDEIVAEVMFPKRQTGKIAILCPGVPTGPSKGKLLEFLANEGYVAILLRYRGSWESLGEFLRHSPHEDVLDVMHELSARKKILALREDVWQAISVKNFILIGASFGGAAVLLASRHPRVKKVVALAPVTDWRVEGSTEPFAWFVEYLKKAFGGAYRANDEGWKKLTRGDFYSPSFEAKTLTGKKFLIFHAADDTIVPLETSEKFVTRIGARLVVVNKAGHLGLRNITQKRYWKIIKSFLDR